ncbi:hypothetical protein BP00DRAFT_331179 [Aspergillus indologenus CBS 114.80]|uniref:Uncharacterized protein n=1 Tax=Aspergillus indologenus CBS 114.80 TaxID=1450541 RepID=A0A2V5JCS0_9EURO|nr:hypothetical protein BP00DRAFT_331179 [Aspergillus indologenus CBS 114.80]
MKWLLRLFLCFSIALFLPLLLLDFHLRDLSDQYQAKQYAIDWFSSWASPTGQTTNATEDYGDKVIVVAKLQEKNTDWIEQELPDWQRALYTVNPSKEAVADDQQLKTPLNKGHESMAYLTYLIEHYEHLPSTIVFLHAHRSGFFRAWHVDAPLHDNVWSIRALRVEFVQQSGYVNLRCNANPGCVRPAYPSGLLTPQIFMEVFRNTSTPPAADDTGVVIAQSGDGGKALQIPVRIAAPCCAQFAVSRQRVLGRPRADYVKIRQWVIDTDLADAHSGRVMEYLWHIIFGKEPVYCPDSTLCYCQVYGRC